MIAQIEILVTLICSNLLKTIADAFQEFGASAVHEPQFEDGVTGQGARRKRLARSHEVVGTKYWLLKGLLVNMIKRQVECLELITGLAAVVDEHDSLRCQNEATLSLELTN